MKIFYLTVNFLDHFEKVFSLIHDNGVYFIINYICQNQIKGISNISLRKPKRMINFEMDAYMYFLLESALESSFIYRALFFENVVELVGIRVDVVKINIKVLFPKRQVLDKRGNNLFEKSCLERRELDHAMAWFSTLGGAFSALGDKMEHCAIMAGKISQQQFLLALRLGDPNLVSRCKLYLALSLIQQKKFAEAKNIIKSQYAVAKLEYERDKRLMAMCLGIWTKWKYDRNLLKNFNGQ